MKLKGVIPALVTAFDANDNFDKDAQAALMVMHGPRMPRR